MRQIIYIFIILAANGNYAFSQTKQERPANNITIKNSETENQDKQTVKVEGYVFNLENCRLSVKGKDKTMEYIFAIPEPCQFSKDRDGTIRTYKTTKQTVIAVESSRPLNNASNDCETNIRGIIISKNSVRLSSISQKVAMCLPFIWDEKVFITFAEKTE